MHIFLRFYGGWRKTKNETKKKNDMRYTAVVADCAENCNLLFSITKYLNKHIDAIANNLIRISVRN